MSWTTTPPTVPGYYWLRNSRIRVGSGQYSDPNTVPVEIVQHLRDDPEDLELYLIGDDDGYTLKYVTGEWYGPIQPPEGEK